jgi:hypothetical protein
MLDKFEEFGGRLVLDLLDGVRHTSTLIC